MSFLSAIIIPKIIAEVESQISAHLPDIQTAIWQELQTLANNLVKAVENKINNQNNLPK